MPGSVQGHTLSPSASLLLDIVRFSAALLVVTAHLGHPEINTGFPNLQVLGDIAVPVFFVLSGFVIRFVTRSREHTLRGFFADRAARIYSVALPGMAVTLAASALCLHLTPAYFLSYWGETSDHPAARILLNLTFLSQCWGHNTIPFLNSPFWSLSYECLYYIAYGLFFYLRGAKRVLSLILWAAVAGPQILFLLPVWWSGCWVYDVFHATRGTRAVRVIASAATVYVILAVALRAGGVGLLTALPVRAVEAFSTLPNPLSLLHASTTRATMFALGTGLMAAVCMLLLLGLAETVPIRARNRWIRRFRHLADGTFAIYLMHYPLMVVASSVGLYRPSHPLRTLATTCTICLLLILTARPLDIFKVSLRLHLGKLGKPGRLSVVPGTV